MKKRIGIQGFLLFLSIVISIFLSRFLFPQWKNQVLDEILDSIGIVIVLLGFLFRIMARGYKSEESDNGKRLVTDGPYRLMRHPMYFGTLLIGIGVILVLFKWWTLPLFLCIFLLIYIPQSRKEEEQLSRRFGNEYQRYFKATPKYFPNLAILFKTDFSDCLFFKWSWLKKELQSLIIAIGVIIAAEIWEDTRLFGHARGLKELIELSLVIIFSIVLFSLFCKRK